MVNFLFYPCTWNVIHVYHILFLYLWTRLGLFDAIIGQFWTDLNLLNRTDCPLCIASNFFFEKCMKFDCLHQSWKIFFQIYLLDIIRLINRKLYIINSDFIFHAFVSKHISHYLTLHEWNVCLFKFIPSAK